MDLRNYIKNALVQICDGVGDAQNEIGLAIAPGSIEGKPQFSPHMVSFEVSVSTSSNSENEKKGGAKIYVVEGGVSSKETQASENMNKISFEVPVHFNVLRGPKG